MEFNPLHILPINEARRFRDEEERRWLCFILSSPAVGKHQRGECEARVAIGDSEIGDFGLKEGEGGSKVGRGCVRIFCSF